MQLSIGTSKWTDIRVWNWSIQGQGHSKVKIWKVFSSSLSTLLGVHLCFVCFWANEKAFKKKSKLIFTRHKIDCTTVPPSGQRVSCRYYLQVCSVWFDLAMKKKQQQHLNKTNPSLIGFRVISRVIEISKGSSEFEHLLCFLLLDCRTLNHMTAFLNVEV